MKRLRGKVAVVTGGGSGIGRGIALALADAGMDIAVADVEGDAARSVARELRQLGVRAIAVRTDVARRRRVEHLAERTYRELGEVRVLVNNAGVAPFLPLDEATPEDWRWAISVNLEGVANGLHAFLPRMLRQRGRKFVVNAASMAGLLPFEGMGIYGATKYAIVGLSEVLREEGRRRNLRVAVLCPGPVDTRIGASERNRPRPLGGSGQVDPENEHALAGEMDPLDVGRRVLRAIEEERFWIFTHPEFAGDVEERSREIRRAFRQAR